MTTLNRVEVYGASDDLIEVDGAGISEEYGVYGHRNNRLTFDDGTVLNVDYDDDGCWNITRVKEGAAAFVHTPHDKDVTTYTDRVVLTGAITKVRLRKGRSE
jgi:hypothetical protein